MSRKNIIQRTCLLFAALCMSVASAFAQDIITLKKGEDIQAWVQEVGEVDVKYKKFENPNGPNYTLKKSEIFMIRYANGSKDVFDNQAVSEPLPAVINPPAPTNQPNVRREVQNRPNPAMDYAAFTQLKRDDRAMEAFLRDHDTELYKQFNRGSSLRRQGKGFLGTGLVVTGVSLGLMVAGTIMINDSEPDSTDEETGAALFVAGNIGLYVGQALIIVSIPLSAVGGSLKKRAANGYEQKYFRNHASYQRSLDFGITQSGGVGFTLNF